MFPGKKKFRNLAKGWGENVVQVEEKVKVNVCKAVQTNSEIE
jgi:hypothetical protein